MRQTHEYTSSNYKRDTGFPLVWIITYLFKRSAAKTHETKEEPDKYHQRNIGQGRKIIGRVAGPEAHTGKSSNRVQGRGCEQKVPVERKDGEDRFVKEVCP